MGTYDPKLFQAIVDGKFITGYDDGTMVSISKEEDTFEVKEDAQGNPIVSEKHSGTATVTITLSQTSPSVALLTRLANQRKEVPAWFKYNGTPKENSGGTRARVKKPSDKEYGDEASSREFEIVVLNYKED